ncbi:MAG: ribonuclease HII [Hyphomicrobiales bacterium]|nr:ribonuclease HII [Hyphomicrobiales bacterium]MCP5371776.1 ribonuclease HII [Hyphomicrobiales bacterium]
MPDFSLEDLALAAGHGVVAGVDEAGRGPWAGPVVAAAVVLDRARLPAGLAAALDDSKKLRPAARADLFAALPACARIGVGMAGVDEIDRVNILRASLNAMARAVAALDPAPDLALVDGNRPPDLVSGRGPVAVRCVVRGDGLSLSIAAASIVAKVTRDRLMAELAAAHPGYGWERNAGYGTAQHQAALARLGPTPHHRRSFAPIRKILGGE